MKFTDGNWMTRPGVRPNYLAQAYEVAATADSLEIVAPTHMINHRGDTLGGPVVNVRISSPMADVIRVEAAHYTGGLNPGPERGVNYG